MDRVTELNTRLDEILQNAGDISVIGYNDLKALWEKIDELKKEANTIAEDMLVGLTRQPNGRFKGKADIEIDINEISTLTTAIDRFTDRAYSEISRINMIEREKREGSLWGMAEGQGRIFGTSFEGGTGIGGILEDDAKLWRY